MEAEQANEQAQTVYQQALSAEMTHQQAVELARDFLQELELPQDLIKQAIKTLVKLGNTPAVNISADNGQIENATLEARVAYDKARSEGLDHKQALDAARDTLTSAQFSDTAINDAVKLLSELSSAQTQDQSGTELNSLNGVVTLKFSAPILSLQGSFFSGGPEKSPEVSGVSLPPTTEEQGPSALAIDENNDTSSDGDEQDNLSQEITQETLSEGEEDIRFTTSPTANFTAPTDDVGSVTGPLTSGDTTDDTALVLTGNNEAGSTVDVYNGTNFLGAATIAGTSWSYSATIAHTATYQFNVKETDTAGNESAATSNFEVTGDTTSPLELSSLGQNADLRGFVINGASAYDRSGGSVSSAGDVNGDGFADLIVGANQDYPAGRSGASFVVFGKTDGTAVELSAVEAGTGGFVINGVSQYDRSGFSVSSAGDVNGDGFADLIVGAPFDDPNSTGAGASFVIFGGQGSSATVGTASDDTLTGDASANQLVAGRGADTLLGNGGADVLRGGEGNDILAISDMTFVSLDGGTGADTLRFDAAYALDFQTVPDSKISSIEIIDLREDNGNSTLDFSLTDILNINETSMAENTLTIYGTVGDTVNLYNTSNGQSGSWAETSGGSDIYAFTDINSDVLASITFDADIGVTVT